MNNLPIKLTRVTAVAGIVGFVVAIFLLIGVVAFFSSFRSEDGGHIGVVRNGGPFDNRNIRGLKSPGSGVGSIGLFSSLHNYPVTQRNYIISSDPSRGDRAGIDIFRAPTSDAVNVGVEGQVLFTLNTDPAVIKDFDTKYGLRTFPVTGGASRRHPYEGDEGFAAFLDVQFRPVLDNALRQEIAKYDCAELNAACRLVRSSQSARSANGTQANGNLAQVQNAISQTLQSDLDSTLGGKFVQNVRFRVSQVTLSPQVNSAVDQANAAKAQVSTEAFRAQAAKQRALAARELARAYQANPFAGLTEVVKALPSGSQPILNLNLGAGSTPTLSVGGRR
jgi:regulator of protease activity HflC (stomatin/prohibitin superfamily)